MSTHVDHFRHRGAAKRSAAFEKDFFAAERSQTKLGALLLELWRWGNLSAVLVQRIAAAAEEDLKKHNVKFREYSILAALGTRRTNKQNCQRDLLRKIPVPLFPVSRNQLSNWCFHFVVFVCCTVFPVCLFPKCFSSNHLYVLRSRHMHWNWRSSWWRRSIAALVIQTILTMTDWAAGCVLINGPGFIGPAHGAVKLQQSKSDRVRSSVPCLLPLHCLLLLLLTFSFLIHVLLKEFGVRLCAAAIWEARPTLRPRHDGASFAASSWLFRFGLSECWHPRGKRHGGARQRLEVPEGAGNASWKASQTDFPDETDIPGKKTATPQVCSRGTQTDEVRTGRDWFCDPINETDGDPFPPEIPADFRGSKRKNDLFLSPGACCLCEFVSIAMQISMSSSCSMLLYLVFPFLKWKFWSKCRPCPMSILSVFCHFHYMCSFCKQQMFYSWRWHLDHIYVNVQVTILILQYNK